MYRLAPVFIAIIVTVAAYYAYAAVFAFQRGSTPFAAFYALFSVAGLVLARAVWSVRKQIGQHMQGAGGDSAAPKA